MEDNVGLYCIINGGVEPSVRLQSVDKTGKEAVYDVIRIMEGVPLFFEDHYLRLKNSLNYLGVDLNVSGQEMKGRIKKLIEANKQKDCNVKVIVYHDMCVQSFLLYISRAYYPSIDEIEQGVKVSLLHMERENPNVKIVNYSYRQAVIKKMKEQNAFEVLLVNHGNKITEGSKSNVFFVKGSKVFTAPDEYVLRGITRKYVIDACKQIGAELIETLVGIDSLTEMEGLFISGTSIKVLPVASIDNYQYKSGIHPAIVGIRDQFDSIVREYIKQNRF